MSGRSTRTDSTKHLLPILGLGILLVLSGCTLPIDQPTKQDHPVRLQFNNTINETTTFEVFVVQRPANLTAYMNDGRVSESPITEGSSGTYSGENQTYNRIELPESAYFHGRFTVEPGESNRTEIDEEHLPVNFALVITVYETENQIQAYMTMNCDDLDLNGYRATRTSYGVSVAHSCG